MKSSACCSLQMRGKIYGEVRENGRRPADFPEGAGGFVWLNSLLMKCVRTAMRLKTMCRRATKAIVARKRDADLGLKFHPLASVENALALRRRKEFGENRVQEAVEKFTEKRRRALPI